MDKHGIEDEMRERRTIKGWLVEECAAGFRSRFGLAFITALLVTSIPAALKIQLRIPVEEQWPLLQALTSFVRITYPYALVLTWGWVVVTAVMRTLGRD